LRGGAILRDSVRAQMRNWRDLRQRWDYHDDHVWS